MHLKGPVELRAQLASASDNERGNQTMKKVQPNPILMIEFKLLVIAIVLQLVMVMHLFESLPHLANELVTFHELRVHDRQAGFTRCVGAQGRWFSIINHLEWSRM
jgi:hypothetical protein